MNGLPPLPGRGWCSPFGRGSQQPFEGWSNAPPMSSEETPPAPPPPDGEVSALLRSFLLSPPRGARRGPPIWSCQKESGPCTVFVGRNSAHSASACGESCVMLRSFLLSPPRGRGGGPFLKTLWQTGPEVQPASVWGRPRPVWAETCWPLPARTGPGLLEPV